jgi:LCP family protein required for cell wall assembly
MKEQSDKIIAVLKLFLKTIFFTLLFSSILVSLTFVIIGLIGYQQINKFTQASGTNLTAIQQTLSQGWQEPVLSTNDYKNFLILGVDSLETRGDVPPLSDTIIVASLNIKNGQIKMLSLPRDLWIDQYQTKINTLLAYGRERYPDKPAQFPQETIGDLINLPIHHTIVLSMEQVSSLIDLVGGVDVEIKESFTDDQFPRTDVDIKTEHDPAKLYEQVEFIQGREHMGGERALKFMRSRHSNGDQGTDIARSLRQQQVILALIQKIKEPQILSNTEILGKLYRYYLNNFNNDLPITQAIATGKSLIPIRYQLLENLTFQTQALSIYPDDDTGVITHPKTSPSKYQNQWVYIIKNEEGFKTEAKSKLNP